MAKPRMTIAPDVIACIAHDDPPSEAAVRRVAAHIENDLAQLAPAFSWGTAASELDRDELFLRVAEAALNGDGSR